MTLYTSIRSHERGSDDNPIQMVADLISSDKSPFLPEDELALRNLTSDTLKKLRNQFLANNSSSCAICGGVGVVPNDLFPERTIPCSCQNPVPEPPSLRESINARRKTRDHRQPVSSDPAAAMTPPTLQDVLRKRS